MGRPRVPKEQHQLTGTDKKKSEYKSYGDSVAVALPQDTRLTAPDRYLQRTKSAWHAMVPTMIGVKILGEIDLPTLGMMFDSLDEYYRAWDRVQEFRKVWDYTDPEDMKTMKALQRMVHDNLEDFTKIAYRFGVTPVERTRLTIPEQKEKDPLEELLGV